MTHDEEIIQEATEIYEKNQNGGALVGDLLRIIKSQMSENFELKKEVEHFQLKNSELFKLNNNIVEENDYKNAEIEKLKKMQQLIKTEAYKEFAEKITEIFLRYAHLHDYAEGARTDYIEAVDGTNIEMQSVWDVFTLKKYEIAEYEEMNRLQSNIELIEKERLLTELEKDFRLLAKELTEKGDVQE